MTASARATLGATLFAGLALPPVLQALESSLPTHLLIQMPALALAGLMVGPSVPTSKLAPRHGGPALAIAITGALFWMLPRSMDAALEHTWVECAKFATLPLAVGLPLSIGWSRVGSVARTFLLANAVPMLAVLGWLYASAPLRVCNFYLIDDQARAGAWLLWLALGLGAALVARAFSTTAPGRVAES